MFGGGMSGSSFSAPGAGFPNTSQQFSMTGIGSGIVSPNSSGLGVGLGSAVVGGGSPIFQSPAGNKFPAGGGTIVFTPHSHPAATGNMASATPVSPYSYVGGSATSFIQSPPSMMGGGAGAYASPIYSSTMINSPHHHPQVASPVTHGYGPPVQYSNMQPFGYGTRAMSGGFVYHPHSPYQQQQHHPNPHHYGHGHHHSPRDEIGEAMHCSPNAAVQPNVVGGQQYQQLHRNPNSPPRSQYMPAFLTGVDAVAAVQPRPRRMFERSPSTSPPTVGAAGSRSPQSKSPNWTQQEGTQPASAGFTNSVDAANAGGGGMYNRRSQGQGPGRQLRFADSQNIQSSQATDEKDKKRNGPPIRGFGSTESEDIANFINSPLLMNNNNMVAGSAIAQEAISKLGANTAIAESNWITVFGFPPAAASFIYTHFSQCGSIIQSKCNPGGNWLHIQYSSRIDARKALANNGKVLGGTIMVGVISSPKEVIEMYGNTQQEAQSNFEPISTVNNTNRSQQSTSVKSPLQERNSDASASTSDPGKVRSIRPLAGTSHVTSPVHGADRSFILPHENRSALSPSGNENMPLPTASSGLLTKAMEYMFGW